MASDTKLDAPFPEATGLLARFAAGSGYPGLPPSVVDATRRVILDTIGCMVGGQTTEKGQLAVKVISALGGNAESSVIGHSLRSNAPQAAFANAELANALDADPVFLNISHFAPVVVAAALALAERRGSSGEDLVAAVAVGMEVGARLTLALLPLSVSPTGAMVIDSPWGYGFGALGAAAAAAALLKLDEKEIAHALGLAGYYAPVASLLKWTRTMPMSMVKYSPMGWTAQAGVTSALLAAAGFTGDPTVLDGGSGFWRFWGAPACHWPALVEQLGERWYSVEYLSFKPYPCCNLYRPHAWLLDQLLKEEKIGPEDIEDVIFHTAAVAAADRPYRGEARLTQVSAHNSAEHVAAMIVYGVPPGPRWIASDVLDSPVHNRFKQRVRVVGNPKSADTTYNEFGGGFDPKRLKDHAAGITVSAKGKSWTRTTSEAKGDAWGTAAAQFADEELAAKFRENCRELIEPAKAEKVICLIGEHLPRLADVQEITGLLQR